MPKREPKYPPRWAGGPSDELCGCGARAVVVHAGWGDGDVLACSASGFTITVCPNIAPTPRPAPEGEQQ